MSELKTEGVQIPHAPPRVIRPSQLLNFNVEADPNALVGYNRDRCSRYICRGYGAWLIGPSGIGKSSLTLQMAFSWALGQPIFGIRPVRPLRVLIVQSENDDGDLAEGVQGVLPHLGVTPFACELDGLDDRVAHRGAAGVPWRGLWILPVRAVSRIRARDGDCVPRQGR